MQQSPQKRSDVTITIRAPAKLNLSLTVIGRRDDGYHEIESFMVPVSLYDTLYVTPTQTEGISFDVQFEGRIAKLNSAYGGDVPLGKENLVVQAAEALAREAGIKSGLEIYLKKQIPSGAGLGGGSSDAAAVIQAAADAWQLNWSVEQLAYVGARLGSDIPWFFTQRPATVIGRGEQVHHSESINSFAAVIVKPAVSLSTALVYKNCQPDASRQGEAFQLGNVLRSGLHGAIPLMHNALQQSACSLTPEIDQLLSDFRRAGGLHPMLTGSGSACFTITRTWAEAKHISGRMESMGWPAVFPVRLCK